VVRDPCLLDATLDADDRRLHDQLHPGTPFVVALVAPVRRDPRRTSEGDADAVVDAGDLHRLGGEDAVELE